jgi:hypothetical protein
VRGEGIYDQIAARDRLQAWYFSVLMGKCVLQGILKNGRFFSMKAITLFLLAGFLAECVSGSSSKPEYTMEFSLRPLRMSYRDLSKVILKVQDSISGSQVSSEATAGIMNELVLKDGTRRFQTANDFSARALESAPRQAYEASYNFRTSGSAISQISIDLDDYKRGISVSGTNQGQVEGLAHLIRDDLGAFEGYWGGLITRMILAIIFSVALLALASRTKNAILGSVLGMASMLVVLLLLIAGARLIPGFVVYRDDPSFIVQWGPEISFLGLIFSALGVLGPTILSRYRGDRKGL